METNLLRNYSMPPQHVPPKLRKAFTTLIKWRMRGLGQGSVFSHYWKVQERKRVRSHIEVAIAQFILDNCLPVWRIRTTHYSI